MILKRYKDTCSKWSSKKTITLVGRDGVDVFVTSTSLAPHLFLLGWLKLNPILLLDQMRLACGDERLL